jgi:Carboxypeptidase regulatory-like domain
VPLLRRFLTVALALAPATLLAQARAHTIRGRVTTDSGTAIPAADVIVTIAPTTESIAEKTDSSGAYKLVIPADKATGEYLLYIGALGRRPFRQRVTIKGSDTSAVVDAKLAAVVTNLAAVQVRATHPRPQRSLGGDNGPVTPVDGLNRRVDGVVNALPPELQGNFDAMATLIPGLAVTSNGVSAFGMGSDANMTTLNGMSFGGGSVPRDVPVTTTFLTSPWDPTRGGFAGALTSATVASGGNITTRRARVTLDSPALQVDDPIAAQFGQKYTNVQLGAAGTGAFSLDKYFYDYGLQASRQTADVQSLLALDADALLHAGISPDSAFRLTQLLGAQHIPVTLGGIPSQRTTTSAQFIERFDRTLPAPPAGATPAPAWNVLVGGDYTETSAGSLSPTVLPATTGTSVNGGGFVQGLYSRYFGTYGSYINETASGVSYRDTRGTPYLSLPSGSVLIASSIAGADPTIGSLNFGGNSALARDTRTWSWEINNQTNFLVHDQLSFPAKLYFQSRYEHYDQSLAANRLGSFSYNSLADVADNTPAAFSRTLNTPDRSGGEWMGAAAAGGSWSSTHWVLAGGARADANAFTGLPAENPTLEQTFGVSNDRAPNSIAVSPRFGFNWFPTAQKGLSMYGSGLSTTYRGGYQIRGGVGEFRGFLPSSLLSDAIGTTGLPGSSERLVCTGPAAPIPDWQAYMTDPSSVPRTCAGGASVFADTAPNVSLIDRQFRPNTAWRATLGWTNTVKNNYIAIDGVYSLNLDQPGTVDLNFAGSPRFTLSSEDNRPVFVSAASIVPTTGSVSAVESRVSSAFGRVADRVSDLRGDARQITVYGIPNIPFRFGIVTIGYTYTDARSESRGFDGSDARDPRAIEWSSQPFTPRHQVVLQAAHAFFGGNVGLTASGRVQSGLRYTPTVAGDINGDGSSNDRAFIFDPSRTTDTAVARGLRDLLSGGSGSARDCLTRQLGTIAGRNSCVGPWTATFNAALVITRLPKTDGRMQATLNLANPLGGLDQLLHGSDKLHGWGSTPLIDGTLYQVRGFDQATNRFIYEVNPRFGSTNPATTTLRSPFRITLDIRYDYGRNREEQGLELNLRVKPPLVGTRATADTIKTRYLKSGFTDLYAVVLRFADSLALTRVQTEQIQAEEKILLAKADTIYAGLAAYLVALPQNYDATEGVKHITAANDSAWKTIYAESPFIRELLTAGQLRRLPLPIFAMVTAEKPQGRFFFGF